MAERRRFLLGLAAAGLTPGLLGACAGDEMSDDRSGDGDGPSPTDTTTSSAPDLPVPDLTTTPFTLGIASGDPLPDAVMLWTRLAIDDDDAAPLPDEVPVVWVVAHDQDLSDVVTGGTAVAEARWGHSVHIDATDLDAATPYHYGFSVGDHRSPVGRTRTAPTATSSPGAVRLGVTSCQAYQSGWFTPYRDLAAADLDAVLFLGDFIYELESSVEARPHGMEVPTDLAGYRAFYALNCRDTDLQSARAAHPWIVTWDDHEVEDNYAALAPGALGAEAATRLADGFAGKRAAAYQAWWEHQPVRSAPPRGDRGIEIHRAFTFGDLVDLTVLDTRQYRTAQPSGEGLGNLPRAFGGGPQLDGAFDPDAQMLGEEQEDWLFDRLRSTTARWNLIAQQSVIAEVNRRPDDPDGGFSMDAWDGYVVPRQRLLDVVADDAVSNPVFLGGDIHTSAVLDVHRDPTDAATPVVATELIAPSLSAIELLSPEARAGAQANPHIHLYDIEHRGWLLVEIGPDEVRASFRYTDTTAPDAEATDGTRWTITGGTPGARLQE